MPKISYTPKIFTAEHLIVVGRANRIIEEYARQGYDLTLRQLYYQFVSRNWIRNRDREYKRLGTIISDARRAGLIDWNAIVDRTRNVRKPRVWTSPAQIVKASAEQYDVDWWEGQPYRPEVWVEKEALVGVLEVACAPWHCPFFACKGYVSDSEAWSAGRRLAEVARKGQTPIILHLGDHDPSGIDMSRDISKRLNLFAGAEGIEVKRIALTMDQIEEVGPPPNPAKITDSRFDAYQREYGDESWELDALNPEYITNLIADEMGLIVKKKPWKKAEEKRDEGRRLLLAVSDDWESLTDGL